MTDDNNAQDPAERSGEVIRVGEAPASVPVQTGTIGWLFSRLSRWPFRNRRYLRSLKTAQEVLEARKQLRKTYIEHEEIRGQVQDLPITIGKQRLQRIREYFAEERQLTTELNDTVVEGKTRDEKNKLKQGEVKRQQTEQEIQQMEQEMRQLRARKQLDELQNPPPPAPPPEDKKKLLERAYARRDRAIKRIEKLTNATPQTKRDLKKAAENALEKEVQRIEAMP